MKAYITARYWGEDFIKHFGPEEEVIVELPDDTKTFLTQVEPFGRFLVTTMDEGADFEIDFQNDYD